MRARNLPIPVAVFAERLARVLETNRSATPAPAGQSR
jgi:hypothetical protein